MRLKFAVVAAAVLAIVACSGFRNVAPNAGALPAAFNGIGHVSGEQRLYVAYHAKPNDWIGAYTTGSTPTPIAQMTEKVSKPYALYADAKGIVYSAQRGFAEYNGTTGRFLRIAVGGRPTPAPVVAPDGTIYWANNEYRYGALYVIPPKQKKYSRKHSMYGSYQITLASPHSIWLGAAQFLGSNEYDDGLHKIRHGALDTIMGVDGTRVYVVQGGSVFVFDGYKFKRSEYYFDIKGFAQRFAFDAHHNVYVTCWYGDYTGGAISEYKAGSTHLIRQIALGTGLPYDAAVDAEGYVYVANALSQRVEIYPPGSDQMSGTIDAGAAPTHVAISQL